MLDIILKIEVQFGTMSVTRGAEHEFLGNKDGTVNINMSSYIEEAIQQSPKPTSTKATTTADRHNTMSPKLSTERSDIFHSIIAKLLYITKFGRPDIQLVVAFLCTRVSCATNEDWRKLH